MADRGNVLDRVTDLLEDKTNTTRGRLENWVNFVLSEMKQAGVLGPDATTTIPTVAGTATYNLPAALDVLDTAYLEDNAGEPLVFVPTWRFAERLADDDDLQGIPEIYTLPVRNTGLAAAPTIRLYPVPQSAWTLRINYQADFSALDDDTDILDLTDDSFTTAMWGVYRIWTRLEEDSDLQAAMTEWERSLARAKWAQFGRIGRTYSVKGDLS